MTQGQAMHRSAKITLKTFELILIFNIVHESRLIQLFVHVSHLIPKPLSRARKNCLERGDHKSRVNKNLNHVSREKYSPDHVSRKKYRGPSVLVLCNASVVKA